MLCCAVLRCVVLCACPDIQGVLVLEELEHAKARGARIYAEYVGGAFTCDAHHMTEPQPQGRGVSSCLHKGLQSAGAQPVTTKPQSVT